MLGRAAEPDRVAVDDVSLSVAPGEVFGLLGQNGAGKTTLVRMITTLLLPTSGSARIDGLDVTREPRLIRSRIGLVNGDERSFYWRMTGARTSNSSPRSVTWTPPRPPSRSSGSPGASA